jgi:nitrate reductase NapE component
MFDEDLLGLRNVLQSVPRREPKIVLERAEYIFPVLKNSLVGVFMFFVHRTEIYECVFPENYFWEL